MSIIQEALDKVLENLRLGKLIESIELNKSERVNCESDHQKENTNENGDLVRENVLNSHEIFGKDQLVDVLKSIKLDKLKNPPRLTVGMIGYPNVGKSSTVNVLMQRKKVSLEYSS